MFGEKIVEVNEVEKRRTALTDLSGSMSASVGVIQASILDLKESNKKIDNEIAEIAEVISQLSQEEAELKALKENTEKIIVGLEASLKEHNETDEKE